MTKDENEKYYWKNDKGVLIPKDTLSDAYICNIVMKFGKNWLEQNGHRTIVAKFEVLNHEYDFFEPVKAVQTQTAFAEDVQF